ncbi:MAG: hypothetical protein J7K75_06795 [Desulfuromonas sp.]|nr:hypothetical protein [Desulfuromonas sp.]
MNILLGISRFLLCLCLVALLPSVVLAQDHFTLQQVRKQDEVNVTRFILEFDRLPEFAVKTSGQRLEIMLKDTVAKLTLRLPLEDERLVRTLVGQSKKKLMLSLLLRRPPYFVNAVKEVKSQRLLIDVHWRDSQSSSRPAIARRLPGQLSVQGRGAVCSHSIDSKYRGDWVRFFREYERPLHLQAPLRYTMVPFPGLQVLGPVDDVLPLEVAELAARNEWQAAISALQSIGYEAASGDQFSRFLLLLAELNLRGENYAKAERLIRKARGLFSDENADLVAFSDLLQTYLATRQLSDPYRLMADLALRTDYSDSDALRPYTELLYAEVALTTGHIKQAQPILEEGLMRGVGDLVNAYQRRLADVDYAQGNYRGALERYHGLGGQLAEAPFSLASFAICLYRVGDYDGAVAQLKILVAQLEDVEQRDLVRYAMAMALIRRGDGGPGYDLLHQIIPGTQGAVLAKAKIADLSMEVDDFHSRQRGLRDYAELAEMMVTREGRSEMQFKHALSQYLLGRRLEAVEEVRDFLKADRMTELAGHAQALLAEILPDLIHGLVAEKKYFSALVLVEQNRELLVASQRDFTFLVELGRIFSRLEFSERAVRLYLYLLDYAGSEERTSQVYVPLLEALMQQQSYDRVIAYADKYQENYSAGEQWPDVYLLKIKAMLELMPEDDVYAELRRAGRPRSEALNRLIATLAWKRGHIDVARSSINAVVGDDLEMASSVDLMFQAEMLYAEKQDSEALQRYRLLQTDENYCDQARYRGAMILLRQQKRQQGLKLLRELVEKGSDSQWRVFAQETLQIERFDR